MNYLAPFLALGCIILLCAGCSTTGRPMRFNPETATAKKDAWYIEGQTPEGTNYSCSFVEFDGQGDYIDSKQHTDAWRRVRALAEKQKILLVFYCHGWKNNSQSGDVLLFNEFLGRLAASPAVGGIGYRVHGVYLSWRGNLYLPYVDRNDKEGAYQRTESAFGEPIIDQSYHRRFRWTCWVQEQLSYWSRRNAAEHKVSSVPIARTIFTCASLAKAIDRNEGRTNLLQASRVMLMGHSFGALLLEQALNATVLDPLTDQWAWFEKPGADESQKPNPNPLPLDFVLFVNSAAPAIYSKNMRDFLTAHQSALRKAESPFANSPVFMSLTSSADKATGTLHPIGNAFAPFYPSLQRTYTNLLRMPSNPGRSVHQSAFYTRTAGHQPLLVNHWIVDGATNAVASGGDIFTGNLDYLAADPFTFWVTQKQSNQDPKEWRLSVQPPEKEEHWAERYGQLRSARSSYWLIRCDKRLIRNHNDVWSDKAMQLYAALYRLVEWTRRPENRDRVDEVFNHYWHGEEVEDEGM